jgi:hypothetical protein
MTGVPVSGALRLRDFVIARMLDFLTIFHDTMKADRGVPLPHLSTAFWEGDMPEFTPEERRAIRERLQIVADALRKRGGDAAVTDIEMNVAATTPDALAAFAARYNQSLDWLWRGDLWPMIRERYRARP